MQVASESPFAVFVGRIGGILRDQATYRQPNGTLVFASYDLIDPEIGAEHLTDEMLARLADEFEEWVFDTEKTQGTGIIRFVLSPRNAYQKTVAE